MRVDVRKMEKTISSKKNRKFRKEDMFLCVGFSKGVSITCIQTVACIRDLILLKEDRIRMMSLNV